MDQRHLHQLLGELHQELLSAGSVDPKSRDLLQHLARDIRAIVDAPPQQTSPAQYHGLRGRLSEAIAQFEASHPRLTTSMERVIDTLAVSNL
jgi:uncharacterized protein DUF4404